LHAHRQRSVIDMVKRTRYIHEEGRHELLLFPCIVGVLDQTCHGIHRAALFAASHLSGVKTTCCLTVVCDSLCRDLFHHLSEAVQ
jgi:hypothetical protein